MGLFKKKQKKTEAFQEISEGRHGMTWEEIDDLIRIAKWHFPDEYCQLEHHEDEEIALALLWGMFDALIDWIEDDEKEEQKEAERRAARRALVEVMRKES